MDISNKSQQPLDQKVTELVMRRNGPPDLRLRREPVLPIQKSLLTEILEAKTVDELDWLIAGSESYHGASDKVRRRWERAAHARRLVLLKEFEAHKN